MKTLAPLARFALATALSATAASASAQVQVSPQVQALPQVQITEWMYSGAGGEYIEFTNLGDAAVDFNGWSFDDDSRTAGTVSLTAFGLVAPGESVILTESSAADFRSAWSLAASTLVIGDNSTNLARGDEINIYDASNNLIDRLTYADNGAAGGPRTQNISANPISLAALAPDTAATGWVLSAVGDSYGSWKSASNDIGNPGAFALAVPEAPSIALMLAGLGLVGAAVRRRG